MDPVIELVNKMFDKVTGDAVTGDAAAHAAAQRTDAAVQRAEMQATMEKEIERREREAAEKACLRMELAQLKKDIAVAEERDSCAVAFTAAGSSAAQHARRQYRCWCVSAIYKRHPRTDNISSQSSTCVAASYYRQRDPC